MIQRPPRSTRTDTLFTDTTLFRSFMVMSCSLSKEDRIPAMCVHPYRHRLQMVRVTAPPHTTAMIKDPVWRDRPNKQFIDDPMNHAVTAADRDLSVPVAAV